MPAKPKRMSKRETRAFFLGHYPGVFKGIRDTRQFDAILNMAFSLDPTNSHMRKWASVARNNAAMHALLRALDSPAHVPHRQIIEALKFIRTPIVKREMERQAFFNGSWHVRKEALKFFSGDKDKRAEKVFRRALFDTDREARKLAFSELAKRIGLSATVDFISSRFPEELPCAVPGEIFQFEYGSIKHVNYLEWAKSKGRFAFFHRGMPVFLVPSKELSPKKGARSKILGRYTQGVIVLNANTRALSPRFRRAIAEHEFGEMFSHDSGQAMQLLWLKRHGLVRDFWQHFKGKQYVFVRDRELQSIAEKFPRDFKGVKKALK